MKIKNISKLCQQVQGFPVFKPLEVREVISKEKDKLILCPFFQEVGKKKIIKTKEVEKVEEK